MEEVYNLEVWIIRNFLEPDKNGLSEIRRNSPWIRGVAETDEKLDFVCIDGRRGGFPCHRAGR